MVLESVYEQDFLDCSYGFRPKRSPHQALESLRNQMMDMRGGWIVEVDIRKFSTLWITRICVNCWGRGYGTGCCGS
jgi:hypothetical protein